MGLDEVHVHTHTHTHTHTHVHTHTHTQMPKSDRHQSIVRCHFVNGPKYVSLNQFTRPTSAVEAICMLWEWV